MLLDLHLASVTAKIFVGCETILCLSENSSSRHKQNVRYLWISFIQLILPERQTCSMDYDSKTSTLTNKHMLNPTAETCYKPTRQFRHNT